MQNFLTGLFGLKGKVAVVIGGGGHICGELARSLARAGASVAVLDIREEKAVKVCDEINDFEGIAFPVVIDVTNKDDHQKALLDVLKRFKDIDILVNGAGINAPTPFMEISLEEWHSILDSHITGTFLSCQIFGKYMVERKKGSVINISSASSGPPLSKAFTYSVAKAGIKNLTQNLAREWAPFNVRVNALRPGFFPTDWSKQNFFTKEREDLILSHTPMGRYGEPAELVGAVLWLSSNASNFVTGAEIAVDGGFSCMTI